MYSFFRRIVSRFHYTRRKVKIFEYPNPENYNNVTGIAFFYIGDMNFRVKVYNVSHEKFIEIIRDSIREYKNNCQCANLT